MKLLFSLLLLTSFSVFSNSYPPECYDGWGGHCVLVKNAKSVAKFCRKHLGFNESGSHSGQGVCSQRCNVKQLLSQREEILGEHLVDKNDDAIGKRVECPFAGKGWRSRR